MGTFLIYIASNELKYQEIYLIKCQILNFISSNYVLIKV